jgi:hypothetical protein
MIQIDIAYILVLELSQSVLQKQSRGTAQQKQINNIID